MLHLDHLKLKVFLALMKKAEHHAIPILRHCEHADFIAEPEQLDCSLYVAYKLVKDILVGVQLSLLSHRWS